MKNRECASSVDGQKGAENISNHFRNQYEELYNQQDSKDNMEELLGTMHSSIAQSEIYEVNRIT